MNQPPVPTWPPGAGRRRAGEPYEGAISKCVSKPRRNLLDLTGAGAPSAEMSHALGRGLGQGPGAWGRGRGPEESVQVGGLHSMELWCGGGEAHAPEAPSVTSAACVHISV